jgi:hypothetical protein
VFDQVMNIKLTQGLCFGIKKDMVTSLSHVRSPHIFTTNYRHARSFDMIAILVLP